MVCSAYFGELSEARNVNWKNEDTNPYDVLVKPVRLENKGYDLLDAGNKYFHDQIQIDWGSFAWKCSAEEIIQFLIDYKETLPWLVEGDEKMIEEVKSYIGERENVEYGVVFIEES